MTLKERKRKLMFWPIVMTVLGIVLIVGTIAVADYYKDGQFNMAFGIKGNRNQMIFVLLMTVTVTPGAILAMIGVNKIQSINLSFNNYLRSKQGMVNRIKPLHRDALYRVHTLRLPFKEFVKECDGMLIGDEESRIPISVGEVGPNYGFYIRMKKKFLEMQKHHENRMREIKQEGFRVEWNFNVLYNKCEDYSKYANPDVEWNPKPRKRFWKRN